MLWVWQKKKKKTDPLLVKFYICCEVGIQLDSFVCSSPIHLSQNHLLKNRFILPLLIFLGTIVENQLIIKIEFISRLSIYFFGLYI